MSTDHSSRDAGDASDKPASPAAPKASERQRARSLLVQALYQRILSKSEITQIEAEFLVDNDMDKVDKNYFHQVLHGVHEHQADLDALITPYLDRPLGEVDPIELSILRLGTYELKHRLDVPFRVVINEGIELAKRFGGSDGHKYVNGILDKLCRRLRLAETRPRG